MKNERKKVTVKSKKELTIKKETPKPVPIPEIERTRDTDFHHVHSFTNLISY